MEPKLNKRLQLISEIAEDFIASAKRKSQGRSSVVLDTDAFIHDMEQVMTLCDLYNLSPERENWFEDLDDDGNNIWSR